MTADVRMVASDLDGTLVGPDGAISPRTLAALAGCLELGLDVVFVTGRPTRWMAPVAAATGHRGLAICSNGAVLYDLGSEQVVRSRPLGSPAVLDAVQRLRPALAATLGPAAFAIETFDGFRREPGYRARHEVVAGARVGAIEELLDDDPVVVKLLARLSSVPPGVIASADAMLTVARSALAGVAEPVHSAAAEPEPMIEVAALGVSKASTLAQLAADRGIHPAEVVAFGDMPNDVTMLRWAGRSYAMADGHPEAIAAADELAPPCAQDGVAQVLERLLAGRVRAGRRSTQ